MTTRTIVKDLSSPAGEVHGRKLSWQTLLMWAVVLVLFIAAIGMRLYNLGLPFDRDTYDEGVYWQSLRAMSAGHPLYQEIFYSQPPFFLLSVYPFFALFGSTLWSARFGIAMISLVGLVGAFLLGKALGRRSGAVAALLLLVVDPFYLAQSQIIQAEASSVAFTLLAVGLAYLWWQHPEGKWGLCYAALTGITLSLSIMSKLLTVSTLVPVGLLMLARLWQIWRKQPGTSRRSLLSIAPGIIAFLAITFLVLLPFLSTYSNLIRDTITFHTDAGSRFVSTVDSKLLKMQHLLTSVLALAALWGAAAALFRQDWRIIPLIAWFFAVLVQLLQLSPLFHHHLISLIPPLIAIAVMGIGGFSYNGSRIGSTTKFTKIATSITLVLILVATVLNVAEIQSRYNGEAQYTNSTVVRQDLRVAADLRNAIAADQFVVTDAQFVAALAERNTPPSLVDTSTVRLETGYVTAQQLISQASQPQVHAVLFYSKRFVEMPKALVFHNWVAQHFRLLQTYGPGQELWIN